MTRRTFRRCGSDTLSGGRVQRCRKPAGASGRCAEHDLEARDIAAIRQAGIELPKAPAELAWWRRALAWCLRLPVRLAVNRELRRMDRRGAA